LTPPELAGTPNRKVQLMGDGDVDSARAGGDTSYEGKLQQMRRHLREQQEQHRFFEKQRREREQELAKSYKERVDRLRASQKEELRHRLSRVQARQKKVFLQVARDVTRRDSDARTISAKADIDADDTSDVNANSCDAELQSGREESMAAASRASPASASVRGAAPAPLRSLGSVARGRGKAFGSSPSAQTGRRRQAAKEEPLGFRPLVNALIQAKDLKDDSALVRLSQTGHGQTEGQTPGHVPGHMPESETQCEGPSTQRHLARRCRLRAMRQVAAQVLQCRRQLAGELPRLAC